MYTTTTPNKRHGSLPMMSLSSPLSTPRGTASKHSNNNNRSASSLLCKGNKLLLGIVALALTYVLTSSPYERIAIERMAYDWNSLEDTTTLAPSRIHHHPQHQALIHPPQPLQVHFLADATNTNPTSKFILDGLERSLWMEVSGITIAQLHASTTKQQFRTLSVYERDTTKTLIYVADFGSMNRDCLLLKKLLTLNQVPKHSPIVLMDFTASHRRSTCLTDDDEDYPFVLETKRSLVQGRYFDSNRNWIHPGQLILDPPMMVNVKHSPLVLRESFVDLIQNVSSTFKGGRRTTDVLFHWKPGDYSHYAFLRRSVAEQVSLLHGNVTSHTTDATYVNALLQSKIVVVAQRDEWEDQYRLYESLASGALVLTDPMLAMPTGLSNATNLLVYRNLQELKDLIAYYLAHDQERQAIAQRGFALVMGRHRSWHRMEEIVFGQAQTSVDRPYAEAPRKLDRPVMKIIDHDTQDTVASNPLQY